MDEMLFMEKFLSEIGREEEWAEVVTLAQGVWFYT
jgi:hypothetical protein